jgi:hypothetical protein
MDDKAKITVEIPGYLKDWINEHDLGQNAIVTMGLRHLYLQEKQMDESILVQRLAKLINSHKLPF